MTQPGDPDITIEVSLVLPAYNEADRIRETVITTAKTLSGITDSYEIIIAEDGSTDGTNRIASQLAKELDYVIHLHSDLRQGRGTALNRAFRASNGRILCYIDVDLATDMSHLRELIEAIRTQGYDFSTGSRMMPSSDVKRSAKRSFASKGFNFFTRTLLNSGLYDHQCGFKAFKRESLMSFIDSVEDKHWFWDTEVLIRAQHTGYKVKEFPVKWRHGGVTKVDLVKDVFGMGSQIIRLWWQLKGSHIGGNRKIILAFILSIILLALIFIIVGIEDVWNAIISVSPLLIGLAVLIYLLSWPIRGLRYKHILSQLGYNESLNFITGSIFISQSANVILPARIGDIARPYILKKKKQIPLTTGMSSIAIERVFDIIAITVIGILSVLIVMGEKSVSNWMMPVMISSVIAILFFFLAIFFLSSKSEDGISLIERIIKRFLKPGDRTDKIVKIAEQFIEEIYIISTNPKSFTIVSFSSLLIWTVDIATCYLVLMAFPLVQNSVSHITLIAVVFLAVAVGNLVKMIPTTPGGIGTYESALTVVLSIAGIPVYISAAVAVIDHFIKNFITLLFGVLYLISFNMNWQEVLKIKDE
ncbi:MAG: flippase-like domain-containing protein [Euryarchaeota archaeon]|nr:flippase-like domain-containing protein [Euryarchaeota archaeon]